MKRFTIVFGATLALATPAMADGHFPGNSGLAKAQAEALKGGAATIGQDLGSKGKGTASAVSGGGNGGWGNLGSSVVSGGQVSNRDGERGTVRTLD